ncbi:MAG: J domain-containing protein [Ignavibacteria bacterium]|jgi:hypothetical protein
MSSLESLRKSADYLYENREYEHAYSVYDDIYRKVWSAVSYISNGLLEFGREYLSNNLMTSIEFKNKYTSSVTNTVFFKWFQLDEDQTLNEFTFALNGKLVSLINSRMYEKSSLNITLNEFYLLQQLVLLSGNGNWVSEILKTMSPQIIDNKLKKIRANITEDKVIQNIIEHSEKLRITDWNTINTMLLNYLDLMKEQKNVLYKELRKIVGTDYSREDKNKKRTHKNYEKYERYEKYEKYERYEKYESYNKYDNDEFQSSKATENEKAKYFGSILELKGIVTKSYIRKKYLELVAKYHPDKVERLGGEFKKIAETKTKRINEAYEWMKKKYNL